MLFYTPKTNNQQLYCILIILLMSNSIVGIVSNNVKCLQNEPKYRKIFHYFNTLPDIHIGVLQETNSNPRDEFFWKAEWMELFTSLVEPWNPKACA